MSAEQRAFFAENGFVHLGRLYNDGELVEIGSSVAAIQADARRDQAGPACRIDIAAEAGARLPVLNGFARVDPVLARHARNPRLAAAASELLAARELRLLEDQVIVKVPQASGRIHWHQDCSYWPLMPVDHISCWLALDETTESSGALQYIPGSHLDERVYASIRLATGRPRDHEDKPTVPSVPTDEGWSVTTVELAPGEVVAHHSRTWHGSPPNIASHERRGVVVRYVPSRTRVDGQRRARHAPRELAHVADGEELHGDLFPVVWSADG